MLTFKQFLEAVDSKKGNYVSVGVDKESLPSSINLVSPSTGKATKDSHVTIVYSKESTVDKKALLDALRAKFKDTGVAKIVSADGFDGEDEKVKCIVLKLHSPYLEKMNLACASFGDIKHSYQDYEPHLTLFYDVEKEEANHWIKLINSSDIIGSFITWKDLSSTTIIEDWNN